MSDIRVEVDGAALRSVLLALNGPTYSIRELQDTRGPNNPIDVLWRDYKLAVSARVASNVAAVITKRVKL